MTPKPEPTEREILQTMRDHVNEKPNAPAPLSADGELLFHDGPFAPVMGIPEYDFRGLQQEIELVHFRHLSIASINPRREGRVNDAVQFAKKVMRRVLSWYTRSLHQFTFAVSRVLEEVLRALASLQLQINTIKLQINTIKLKHVEQSEAVTELQGRVNGISGELQDMGQQLHELRLLRIEERLRSQELKVRRLETSSDPGTTRMITPRQESRTAVPQMPFDYFLFEEYHRGSESLIKERQRHYVKYFEGKEPVWDLGCGRGEFLELLREAGIVAQGVENSPDAFHLCKEKGLNVTQTNLFTFLEDADDESAGGIFAAQVIEHLPVELQLRFVDLCYIKLKPGSALVIETINPECLFALVRNFYLDPTHMRPVHPEMLRFAMESKGFCRVKVRYSGPVEGKYLESPDWPSDSQKDKMTQAVMALNHFAFGFQDYAIVGWRA
jgi:2-polyprenyl-3-methyl-5-hydroxy-6-metoxy-1,4-benzoquinol methylase